MDWIRAAVSGAACAAIAALPAFASVTAPGSPPVSPSGSLSGTPTANEATTRWLVDRADNVCGLDDPKMLSKPAKLDYDALLKATAEMKKIKDDKINPNSPQGIQLRQAAATRVQTAAEKVRAADGYCSVWKTIKHQDGRAIPDITDAVKALL